MNEWKIAAGVRTVAIHCRAEGKGAVLAVEGELVYGCAEVLGKTLAELPTGTERVVLDMAGVTFMDSAGLQFLDHLHDYRRRELVPVATRQWRGQPRRVLELSGLDTTDPLRPSPAGLPPRCPSAVPSGGADRPVAAQAVPARSAVALERAERMGQLNQEIEQLRQAMTSRPVIDQARGILMATQRCTADHAWKILVDSSQHTNIKLRTLATAITRSANGPAPSQELCAALRRAASRHRD